MATYHLPVKFIFEGKFEIQADSPEETTMRIFDQDCGMTINNGVHSTRDDVVFWDFPVHPLRQAGPAVKVSP